LLARSRQSLLHKDELKADARIRTADVNAGFRSMLVFAADARFGVAL